MWNSWPFRRFTWHRRGNVYSKGSRQFSWGRGADRIGYLTFRDGGRTVHVLFEFGSWAHDIVLRHPEGPWTRDDGITEPVTLEEAQMIVANIAEALGERDYKVQT